MSHRRLPSVPVRHADVAFPVGHLAKGEVRALAARAGLPVAARRSSAGICFIGAQHAPSIFLAAAFAHLSLVRRGGKSQGP